MNSSFSFKKALLGLVAMIILFISLALFINLSIFDEELSPEIVEILKPSQKAPLDSSSDSENAYFALWGISAADDKDMFVVGKKLIERYFSNRETKNLDQLSEQDYNEILGNENIDDTWLKSIETCQSRLKPNCTSQLSKKLIGEPIINPRLDLLLSRYLQMIKLTNYQQVDNLSFTSPLPNYGTLMKLSRINIARSYNSDAPQEFSLKIAKDLKFWKLMLEQGDTLIDKMVAIARIWDNLQALSEYINNQKNLTASDYKAFESILSPLTSAQLNISEAFSFELRMMYQMLTTIDPEQLESTLGVSATPVFWMIQPNATINDYHQYFIQPIEQLSQLSVQDFSNAISKIPDGQVTCCFKELESMPNFTPSSLYNLGGKVLLPAAHFQAQDYLARAHDINTMFSLIKLQIEIKQSPHTSINEVINHSKIVNPYTGKPMEFELESGLLGFDCLDTDSVCKIVL